MRRGKAQTIKVRTDTFWTQRLLKHPYLIEHKGVPPRRNDGQLTFASVGLDASKPLITRVKTGDGNALHIRKVPREYPVCC